MKDITVILTAYKRDYFDDQIKSIKSQKNVNIDKIFIWQNGDYIDLGRFSDDSDITLIKSDMNLKFHGRFTLPLLFQTEYTAVFDDDTIPGDGWLENSTRCCEDNNCITGSNGRWRDNSGKWYGAGDDGYCSSDLLVDFVGHSWVFKTEWIRYMWRDATYTYENGEDIQFCLSSKLYGDIDSYVAKQDNPSNSSSRNPLLSSDQHASYKLPNHGSLRDEIFEHWESKGYKKIKS
jgi:hypothetical protein